MTNTKTYAALGAALALTACASCAPRTIEAVPGYPQARYDRTYASEAYAPEEIALVLDAVLADPTNAGVGEFRAAIESVEIVVIDRDMSGWEADAFSKGAYISVGQGDAHIRDAQVGSTDGANDRILVALRHQTGEIRPLDTHDFITHEFEHLRCFVLFGDGDYNHATAPGPWDGESDARIVREDADLVSHVQTYNDKKDTP